MNDSRERSNQFILFSVACVLGLAWVGVWGAWIQHPSPALTRNAIGLAEWSPYLDEVRSGAMTHAPTLLRVGVSLLITALAVAAVRIKPLFLRWVVRLLLVIPALWMLPPYPEITAPFALGYGPRLMAAGLALVGVGSTLLWDALGTRVQLMVIGVGAAASAACTLIGFSMISGPFNRHYDTPLTLGWGLFLTVFALMIASVLVIVGFMRNAKQGA